MTKEPLIVLVKMGESHAELVADLETYAPRARAGRLRNLALAGLLLQQQRGATSAPPLDPPAPRSTPQPAPPTEPPQAAPDEPGADDADTKARTKANLRRSLGMDEE